MSSWAAAFAGQQYLNLETIRRNGTPVRTPVWFAADGETLYVYTQMRSGKVKRIRHTAAVRVAVCDARGRISGPWRDGCAHIVDAAGFDHGMRLLNKKYGLIKRLLDLFARHERAVIAITSRQPPG
jgi:PPOX class probable F420-dependent enzyme